MEKSHHRSFHTFSTHHRKITARRAFFSAATVALQQRSIALAAGLEDRAHPSNSRRHLAHDVVPCDEHHEYQNEGNANPESDVLNALTKRLPPHRLDGIK